MNVYSDVIRVTAQKAAIFVRRKMGSVTGFVMAVLTLTITLTTIAAGTKVDTSYGRKNRPNKHKKTGVPETRTKVTID